MSVLLMVTGFGYLVKKSTRSFMNDSIPCSDFEFLEEAGSKELCLE